MEIAELKKQVADYRSFLKEATGKMPRFSETGPANMGLIDALVAVVEKQEQRIVALEKRGVVKP
ncbi:MAG: hypothetical protein ABSB74_08575 [Tepidisphaeraceae bacterium]